MALVEVTDVILADEDELLAGRYIDMPEQGSLIEAWAVDLVGWALGRNHPVMAVEVACAGTLLSRVPMNSPRPDLVSAFPDSPHAGTAGFRTTIDILTGRTPTVELVLRAVLRNGARVQVGVIRMRRRWPESVSDSGDALVSVVIPCYNQAHFLGEAIESALAQTHPNVEVVVVDDGSTDNTLQVASQYPGVRLALQDNQGLAAARNTGIQRSNGDFLVFLDADDRLLPGGVEAGLLSLKAHPEAAFTAGQCRLIAFDRSNLPSVHPPVRDDPYAALLRNAPIWAPGSVMFHRSVFRIVGRFDTSISPAADYDLFYRIAKDHQFAFQERVVVEYRRHGGNMSRDPVLMLRSNLAALRRQKRHVRHDQPLLAAYREGVRYWRQHYGTLLVEQARSHYQQGRFRDALRQVPHILRYYPRGIGQLRARAGRGGASTSHGGGASTRGEFRR